MSHPCFLKDFFIVYVCMSINERHTERGGEKDKEGEKREKEERVPESKSMH